MNAINKPKFFVRGDLDGLFGLFIDNLLQLMLIYQFCRGFLQFPDELVTGRIIPGAALSILLGNAFYTLQARRLMVHTGRNDITALPYGINTPSLIAYIFFIMGPIYHTTKNVELAWQAGLFACLMSGLIECAGAFFGDWLRRHTPKAALLSALAGIGLTFISMWFIFQLFANPSFAILPMFIILISYAGKFKWMLGIPGGVLAVCIGTLLAWGLKPFGIETFTPDSTPYQAQIYLPQPAFGDLWSYMQHSDFWSYFAVIVPMGLFNALGSLQNLESAESAGDSYPTRPSMLANGIGTIFAACFGSAFPTTIYIGHPAWKAMGARAGYSLTNGILIAALSLMGGVVLILKVVPIEATLGILLWIGIIITAQSYSDVPRHHALAVTMGIIPSIAAWLKEVVLGGTLRAAGSNFEAAWAGLNREIHIHGIIALSQGFLLNAMIFAAITVWIIERKFLHACYWCLAAGAFSAIGIMHAYDMIPGGFIINKFGFWAAGDFAAVYFATALLFLVLHLTSKPSQAPDQPSKT